MNANTLTKALQALFGGSKKNQPIDAGREAVGLLTGELDSARQALDALLAQRDELTLQAMSKGKTSDLDAIRERVQQAERRVAELSSAHSAAWSRLRSMEDTEAAAAIAARWKVARDLIDQRSAAGVRLQAALDAAAAAIREIGDLDHEIMSALPEQPRHFAYNFGGMGLEHLVQLYLATVAPPLFAKARGLLSIDDLKAGSTLSERIRADGEMMLAAEPAVIPETVPA